MNQHRFAQLQTLDSRFLFAFGDLDTSWNGSGIVVQNQYQGDDLVVGMAIQPNGQLLTLLENTTKPGTTVTVHSIDGSPAYESSDVLNLKRRLLNGQLDTSFGGNGTDLVNIAGMDSGHDYNPQIVALGDSSIYVSTDFEGHALDSTSHYYLNNSGKKSTMPGYSPFGFKPQASRTPDGSLFVRAQNDYFPDDGSASTYQSQIVKWNRASASMKTSQTPLSTDFNVGRWNEAFPLSDGTYLIRQWGKLIHRAADLNTTIKFGNSNSINLPASLSVSSLSDAFIQGKYIVLAGFDSNTGKNFILRMNRFSGALDTNFGKNNSSASGGILKFSVPVGHVSMLDDGSLVYAVKFNTDGKVYVGHLTRDGQKDTTYNTALNGNAHPYSIGKNGAADDLIVGANGQVYVSAYSSGPFFQHVDAYILKLKMITAKLGKISGVEFNDTNKNNLKESTETVAVGKTIFIDDNGNGLLDSSEWRVVIDSSGKYSFDGLLAGSYKVRTVLASGYKVTSPVFATGSVSASLGATTTANIGIAKV